MDLIVSTDTLTGGVYTVTDTAADDTFVLSTGILPVALAADDKVKITNAANALKPGDKIRIGNQVRTVTTVSASCTRSATSDCSAIASAHYVMVDADFVEDEFSSHDNIFDAKHTVERLESDSVQAAQIGSELATCTVTDIRQLSTTKTACDKTDGPACGTVTARSNLPASGPRSAVGGTLAPANRVLTMDSDSYLMDP